MIYGGLPAARRARLHARIGTREEAGYVSRPDERAATLALHFERGGDPTRALGYRRHAGDLALRRHAYADAVGHLRRALALLPGLPDARQRLSQELDVQIALGRALMATRGYGAPEVEQTYVRARSLCRGLGDTKRLVPVLLGLRRVHSLQARLATARRLSEECLALGRRTADTTVILEGHLGLAVTLCFQGRFGDSLSHANRGWRLFQLGRRRARSAPAGEHGVGCLAYGGLALWFLGRSGDALQKLRTALDLAEELADPFAQAYALIAAAWLHQFRGDVLATRESGDAAIALSRVHGFPLREAQGTILAGWALSASGEATAGIARMRQGLELFESTGSALNATYYLALLAEAHAGAGQIAEGVQVVDEAFERLRRGGERWWEAELYRLRGLLRSRHEHPRRRDAAADLRRALAVARRQHARPLELRAAAALRSLGRTDGGPRACQSSL